MSQCWIPAAVVSTRSWSCVHLFKICLWQEKSGEMSFLLNKTQPLGHADTSSIWMQNLKRNTYLSSTMAQWMLFCFSPAHPYRRIQNIQMCIWHFLHDVQMNNSGLIFRRGHELNIQYISQMLAVSVCPAWAVRLFVSAPAEFWCSVHGLSGHYVMEKEGSDRI